MRYAIGLALLGLAAGGCGRASSASDPLPVNTLRLPPGFEVSVYAHPVEGARSLALGDKGTVFVGTRRSNVYALVDADGNGAAEAVHRIATDLTMPNGVAFRQGALYVAEVSRILRYDGIEARLTEPPRPVVVTADFPSETHHGWKFIAFGPDGLLYVPVGAPCNLCLREDAIFSTITRIKPDGSGREIVAHGVRNTVGFDWHPATKELWFTENGRDWMGDDRPPDELNVLTRTGQHFGFPYCHGKGIQDTEFRAKPCSEFTPPVLELGPHVAAIGMRFYTGEMFPPEYRQDAYFAEHGSWNRTQKLGYRVMRARFQGGRAVAAEPFLEGWLQGDEAWGRPVDVLNMPDGSLLVSDDKAGAVYRITYKKPS